MGFIDAFVKGISLGSVYAIIALGYTMVYGIAKMLNFAHGDVIMVGGFTIFFAIFSSLVEDAGVDVDRGRGYFLYCAGYYHRENCI